MTTAGSKYNKLIENLGDEGYPNTIIGIILVIIELYEGADEDYARYLTKTEVYIENIKRAKCYMNFVKELRKEMNIIAVSLELLTAELCLELDTRTWVSRDDVERSKQFIRLNSANAIAHVKRVEATVDDIDRTLSQYEL